jgi:hypothetical protein
MRFKFYPLSTFRYADFGFVHDRVSGTQLADNVGLLLITIRVQMHLPTPRSTSKIAQDEQLHGQDEPLENHAELSEPFPTGAERLHHVSARSYTNWQSLTLLRLLLARIWRRTDHHSAGPDFAIVRSQVLNAGKQSSAQNNTAQPMIPIWFLRPRICFLRERSKAIKNVGMMYTLKL